VPHKKPDQQRKSIRVFFKDDRLVAKYQFLSDREWFENTPPITGTISNLSMGGACVLGEIQETSWLMPLGEGHILVGCNILVDDDITIKTISQVRWVERTDESQLYRFGLKFIKLDIASRALLGKFLIRKQINTRKLNRSKELLSPEYYEVHDESETG